MFAGVNKKIEFSRNLTKVKTQNLKEFYWKVNQYLRLEDADVELAMKAQIESREPS